MIFDQPSSLRQRILEVTRREPPIRMKVFEDTTQFMSIDVGDVIRISGSDYLIIGHAREGRFGIDDQPKFWVKTCLDLTTGLKKIIKLVFLETFENRVGETIYRFLRSPDKEASILQTMQGHPNFMQGCPVLDSAGNIVRIIDFISGPSLFDYLRGLNMSHKEYFNTEFLNVVQMFIQCVKAISLLHEKGLHHGDIRADHIIIRNGTKDYMWIDFDYEVSNPEYDAICLGNVLQQVVGKGRHSLNDIQEHPENYPDFRGTLTSSDMSLMFRYRVANLQRLYPHIPGAVNDMVMRYSNGCSNPYKRVADLLFDLCSLFPGIACS